MSRHDWSWLLVFGWALIAGGAIDAVLAIAAVVVITSGDLAWNLDLEVLFRDHLSWLYWLKQIVRVFMPESFVIWFFALPAVPFFVVRVVVSGWLGQWIIGIARHRRALA